MSKEDLDIGFIWHLLAGAGIGIITGGIGAQFSVWLIPIIGVVATGIMGWLREVKQHDWNLTWPHQIIEAMSWGIGALVGVPIGVVITFVII